MQLNASIDKATFFKAPPLRRLFQNIVFFLTIFISFEASSAVGSITSVPTTTTEVDSSYSYTLLCEGAGAFGITTSSTTECTGISLVTAPAGMTVVTTGSGWQQTLKVELHWTPSQSQAGSHTVQVENSISGPFNTNSTYNQTYTLTVSNRAPTITSNPDTVGYTNVAYQYQVTASDGDGHSLSYSLSTKPAGMTITNAGLINWTPTAIASTASDC